MSQGKGQALWMSESTDKADNAIPFSGTTDKLLRSRFEGRKLLPFGCCQYCQSTAFKWGNWFKAFQLSNLNYILGLNQNKRLLGEIDSQDIHKPNFLSLRRSVLICLYLQLFYTFFSQVLVTYSDWMNENNKKIGSVKNIQIRSRIT